MGTTLAYQKGDKVVHPAHGAGIVKKVVLRTIAGEPRKYYLIYPLAHDDLEVMVAIDKVRLIGLRGASKRSKMRRTMRRLQKTPQDVPSDYKKRKQVLAEKLRSSDPYQLADVARDLAGLKTEKGGRLGVTDTKFLKQACESLAGELALVEEMSFDDALAQVGECLMLDEEAEQG
jgi:CarD family transcriptional regulator